jgi:hypothetical protein
LNWQLNLGFVRKTRVGSILRSHSLIGSGVTRKLDFPPDQGPARNPPCPPLEKGGCEKIGLRGRMSISLTGEGANSSRQNPAGDAWPGSTSPASAERSRQLPKTLINIYECPFHPPWVKYRAGHREILACFGGLNLLLPRASPDPPFSRFLNSFTASGKLGDFRDGSAHQEFWLNSGSIP